MSKNVGFLQLRRGIWDHLRIGRMTPLETLAFIYICSEADTRTGVWRGSAGALVGELAFEPRTARDVLERMERDGYIRRFAVPGSHLCYPILVHKYLITNGEHNGEQLNALSSTFIDGCVKLAFYSREENSEVNGKDNVEDNVEDNASQKRSKNRELIRKKREEGKEAEPLPPELQKLVTELEHQLLGQMSGWDWNGQIEPMYAPIRKSFENSCADHGKFSKSNRLYEEAFERVRIAVETPTERICPNPIGPLTEQRLQQLVAEDPDCTGGEMLPDGSGKMYFALGTQWISKDGKPRWCPSGSDFYFAFDGELTDEQRSYLLARREPVVAHAMPDVPTVAG
jgi:hypothetical protein